MSYLPHCPPSYGLNSTTTVIQEILTLALINPRRWICHKTAKPNQTKPKFDHLIKIGWSLFLKIQENHSIFLTFNRLIDFNGISTHQGLFYAYRLRNRVHCSFIFAFLCNSFLRGFFALCPSKTDLFDPSMGPNRNYYSGSELTRK